MNDRDWPAEILDFWFAQSPDAWWQGSPEFDIAVSDRFLKLWEEQQQRPIAHFQQSPELALAAIILFDQFPRNMFRGHAQSYATDHMALALAREAVDRGFDDGFDKDRRTFLYMPFEHSEDEADQRRSVGLFTALGDPELIRFARKHLELIERFGRFPHRNPILGRTPRPDEVEAGPVFPW